MASTLGIATLETAVDTTGLDQGLNESKTKAQGATNQMGLDFKAAASGAIVAGAVAIGAAMADAADDAAAAMNTIEVGLGATGAEAEALGEIAKDVWKDGFGASIDDAATALVAVRQQFGNLAEDELAAVTEKAFMLQDSFGVDIPTSIDASKTLMENFGLTSEEAFDFIASGFQRGLDRSGDFLDTIGEYSTQFASGGADAAQFFSLLESGMQGGMLGTDKAADAFKEFRVRIQDGSTLTAQSLEMIGLSSEELAAKMADGSLTAADAFQMVVTALGEVDDENIRMQAGVGLLGTQFEDLGTEGALSLSLIGTEMEDLAGATDTLNEKYDTLGDSTERIKRIFLDLALPVAEKAMGETANVAEGFVGVLDAMEDSSEDGGNTLRSLAIVLNEVSKTFGGIPMDDFVDGIGEGAEAAADHTAAMEDLNAAGGAWAGQAGALGEIYANMATAEAEVVATSRELTEITEAEREAMIGAGEAAQGEFDAIEGLTAAQITNNVQRELYTQAAEAAAEADRRAAEAVAELKARTGDYFEQALSAGEQTKSLEMTMFDMAGQAGLGAEEMAIFAEKTGEFSQAEIDAAFQAALMKENINQLVQSVAAGQITALQAAEALQVLKAGEADTAAEAVNLAEQANQAAAGITAAENAAAGAAPQLDAVASAAGSARDQLNSIPTDITISINANISSQLSGIDFGDPDVQSQIEGAFGGGMQHGGFTGFGRHEQVAGVVHREELVVPSAVLRGGLADIMEFARKHVPTGILGGGRGSGSTDNSRSLALYGDVILPGVSDGMSFLETLEAMAG